MAQVIDFEIEKRKLIKEIQEDICSEDWYVREQLNLHHRFVYVKLVYAVDLFLVIIMYMIW